MVPRLLLLRKFWVFNTAGDFLQSSRGGCADGPVNVSTGVLGALGGVGVLGGVGGLEVGKIGGVCRAVGNQNKVLG